MSLQMVWRFDYVVENVQRMLAKLLLILFVEDAHRTRARRDVRDSNGVDVSGRACDLDCFARAVCMIRVAAFFNAAFTIEDEHALRVGPLESVVIRLWWVVHVAITMSGRV